jgi:hypothetical protein
MSEGALLIIVHEWGFANLDLSDDFLFEEGDERTEDGSLCADGVPLEVSFLAADLADGF